MAAGSVLKSAHPSIQKLIGARQTAESDFATRSNPLEFLVE
jgi:hypothetical protein